MRGLFSLLQTLSASRRRQFALLTLTLLVAALAEVAKIGAVLPVVSMAATPGKLAPGPHLALAQALGWEPLVAGSLILIVAGLVAVATQLLLLWLTHRFVVGIGRDISEQIFSRMLRQPYEAYKIRSSSEILSGLEKVRTIIFQVLLPAMQAFTAIVISSTIIVVLLVIDPVVASLAAVLMAAVFLIAQVATRGLLDRNSRTVARTATAKMNIVQEALGNIRDILIDRSQPVFEASFSRSDAQLRRAQSLNILVAAGPRALLESAAIVGLVAATLLATNRPDGVIGALPALGALALGAQRLLPLLQQIYSGWAFVAGSYHSITDVIELMRVPIVPDTLPDGEADAGVSGDIVLTNVSFGFAGAAPVLRDVTLHIPRGARVGIVGESGSGKSTLVDIVMGLLPPTSGTISIGGAPMDEQLRRRWQARIAHVPQSVYLSDASITSNIAFGIAEDAIDHDRVAAAAETAQAAGFIGRFALGYETKVGEGGARLSGGERQRIGLARALYKQADVLILDEATSALAEEMEAAVLASLERRGGTLIIVSHRRSSLAGCDLIVRMENGRAHVL